MHKCKYLKRFASGNVFRLGNHTTTFATLVVQFCVCVVCVSYSWQVYINFGVYAVHNIRISSLKFLVVLILPSFGRQSVSQ